jgi:hypothetical protein
MTTLPPILAKSEHDRLVASERIELGYYHSGRPASAKNFVIELDACPLAFLILEAARGNRVYEFLSIQRPGDILHYLWVQMIDVDDEVIRFVESRRHRRISHVSQIAASPDISLHELDSCLQFQGDDAEPFEDVWSRHRSGRFWKEKASELLSIVKAAQDQLRRDPDFLLQHEIQLIDARKHRRDFMAEIERRPILEAASDASDAPPDQLFEAIQNLIRRDDVRSVSCPFRDLRLWKVLVAEQLQRVAATGLPGERAFGLFCPDSGLDGIPVEDWGGDVHISYEGVCGSDLFILPSWHRFSPERLRETERLSTALGGKLCNHLLLRGDHGDLPGVSRTLIGEWVLYSSTTPSLDCHPMYRHLVPCLD